MFLKNQKAHFQIGFVVCLFVLGSMARAMVLPNHQHINILKDADKKYLAAKSISMKVHRYVRLATTDREQQYEGSVWLKGGKFRLELLTQDKNKDKSMVVADGAHIWLVSYPSKDMPGAKMIVQKASLQSKRAKSQGLLQMLTEGGVVKYFKVTGVEESGKEMIYFLQPLKSSVELRRAKIKIDTDNKNILQLSYWDSLDNETRYSFDVIEFDKKVDTKLFSFKPPKGADVSEI